MDKNSKDDVLDMLQIIRSQNFLILSELRDSVGRMEDRLDRLEVTIQDLFLSRNINTTVPLNIPQSFIPNYGHGPTNLSVPPNWSTVQPFQAVQPTAASSAALPATNNDNNNQQNDSSFSDNAAIRDAILGNGDIDEQGEDFDVEDVMRNANEFFSGP